MDMSAAALSSQAKFFAYTMDSMQKMFFGKDIDTLHGQHDAWGSAFDEAHRAMILYMYKMLPILIIIGKLPWPFGGWIETGGIVEPLVRMLHPTGRKFNSMVAAMNAEASAIIQARRNDPMLAQGLDLLARFMNSRDEDGVTLATPKHEPLLRSVIKSFYIAGRDTTACTLSWTFFLLATHPDLNSKVNEEIEAALGGTLNHPGSLYELALCCACQTVSRLLLAASSAAEEPNFFNTSARRMPYLHGAIYEALRLYPPVAMYAISFHDHSVVVDTSVPHV
jgi:cytochrome P450